jgi:ABC-type multidrug transport system fused ATPase/permease subunit
VRDNEDAARAIGVDPFRVKLRAIGLSGALMGAAGAIYVQVFQYIDPGIAYGGHTSVEALVAAIVGGLGTLWGPVLGALVLHLLADATRSLFGGAAWHQHGDLRRGAGGDRDVRAARHAGHRPVGARTLVAAIVRSDSGRTGEGERPWLARCCALQGVSKSFGGLAAVQNVSLEVPAGSLSALIGPNGAGKTTLFALMSGFLAPDAGRIEFDGADITGQPPHLNARRGMTRTFQIVQPFAAQTVRENIAVGAHLHCASRQRGAGPSGDGGAARRPGARCWTRPPAN